MHEAQETAVQPLDGEHALEKEAATHSRIRAWRVPWTEGPGGARATGSQRTGHDMQALIAHRMLEKMNPKRHNKTSVQLLSGV